MATPSTDSRLTGACSWVGVVCAGICSSSRLRRCQLWRAATKPFQCAIARSTGASARALEDRAGDDDAGGRLLVDDEIGADREHGRLQHHAQHLCDRAETAGDVAGALIAGEIFLVGLAPARGQPAGHAHRDQHFGVAAAGLRRDRCAAPQAPSPRCAGWRDMNSVTSVSADQDDGADQRGDADQPWKAKQMAR